MDNIGSWPIRNCKEKVLRKAGSSGGFWEDRKDRFHCGHDIYTPEGSDVFAVQNGEVLEIGISTSPEFINYWNITQYIVIKLKEELLCIYAELGEVFVNAGDIVKTGDLIGKVGLVINRNRVNSDSPDYIKKIVEDNHNSMLHFELCKTSLLKHHNYLGGNWFGKEKPDSLLDPYYYLNKIINKS